MGVPDDEAGEAVTLFVTVAPGEQVGVDDVAAFMRANLPKFMVPRSVVVLDSLPLTVNGKVAKGSLRELASTPAAVEAGRP